MKNPLGLAIGPRALKIEHFVCKTGSHFYGSLDGDAKRRKTSSATTATNFIQIENLPPNFTRILLRQLTKGFPGEPTIVDTNKPGCSAIMKFDSPEQAKAAMLALNGLQLA